MVILENPCLKHYEYLYYGDTISLNIVIKALFVTTP